MKITDAGKCAVCLIKPIIYKRTNTYWCAKCHREYDLTTGEWQANNVWLGNLTKRPHLPTCLCGRCPPPYECMKGWHFKEELTKKDGDQVLLLVIDQHTNRRILDAHYSNGAPCPEATYPPHAAGWYTFHCGSNRLVEDRIIAWRPRPELPTFPIDVPIVQVMGKAHCNLTPEQLAKVDFGEKHEH